MSSPSPLTAPIPPLHVYILLDSSASMHGAPQVSLVQGLQLLCGTFIARSKRPVQVALIGFDSTVRALSPLSEVNDFEPPILDAGGPSGLCGALSYCGLFMCDPRPAHVSVLTAYPTPY